MSEVTHRLATTEAIESLVTAIGLNKDAIEAQTESIDAALEEQVGELIDAIEALPNATQEAADNANEAAEAAMTAVENVSDLVDNTFAMTPITMVAGKYIDLSGETVTMSEGVPQPSGDSSNNYAYGLIACNANDAFTVSGHGGSQTRLFGFVDSSGNILSVAAASSTADKRIVVAPASSAWCIVHTNDGKISYKGISYATLHAHNAVDVIEKLPRNNGTGDVTFTWNGNECTVNGTSGSSNVSIPIWTNTDTFMPDVHAGDKLYMYFKQGANQNVGMLFTPYVNGTAGNYIFMTDSGIVEVPANATAMTLRLNVRSNTTVSHAVVEPYVLTFPEVCQFVQDNVDALRNEISSFVPYDVLKDFGDFRGGTQGGITYTWNDDHETCVLDGETTNFSYYFLWAYTDGLPPQINPGERYNLEYSCSDDNANISCQIYYRYTDSTTTSARYTSNAELKIPENCNGITIRLYVQGASNLDNVTVKIRLMTVSALEDSVGVANHVVKMLSVGSSFMTGQVWINGNYNHTCTFENSPYGNVAIALGIPKSNVTHYLMGSTGLLYGPDPDDGKVSILEAIESMDVSGYDYILTQFNRPDMGMSSEVPGYPVGDLTSEAGDGSIVGGVLELLAYMKENCPTATLILVGPPPSAQTDAQSGANVFTCKYRNGQGAGQGSSIGEADLMMHRLAVREHFIFMDWEDLNLSYYYRDFCDDNNVHPNTDAVCRMMGMYLARNVSYTSSLAKVMAADMNG